MQHGSEAEIFLSVCMFVASIFAASSIVFSTGLVARRFHGNKTQAVLVNMSVIALDQFVVNAGLAICLLLECSTLVWDELCPAHFPLVVRWPLVLIVLVGVTFCGTRLFRQYLRIDKIKRLRDDSISDTPLPDATR